jgi:tRNA pseudouridine38-40 synthase
LYLGGVYYPERFGLAKHPLFERLPPDARRFEPDHAAVALQGQ